MVNYGTVNHVSIVGTFDGWVRIITEDPDGDLHDFQIPFNLTHGPDSFYVDFDFENTDYEGPDTNRPTVISCPDRFKDTVRQEEQEIIRQANV